MPSRELILHPLVGQCLTLESLAAEANLHPDLVGRFFAYGLLESVAGGEGDPRFAFTSVRRVQTICRLREDLGMNLPGIAVVLDLLERLAPRAGQRTARS